jgi:hypothetical protein
MPEDYPQEVTTFRPPYRWTGGAMLGLAAMLASTAAFGATAAQGTASAQRLAWLQSPERRFLAPRALSSAHAVLFDEAVDPALVAAVATELGGLNDELYSKQGWRSPFADDEPLRIYVARRESGGMGGVAGRPEAKGRLESATLVIDATGLSTEQIAREVGRQVALATLDGYGIEDAFLGPAIAEYLTARTGAASSEDVWIAAAAGSLDFRAHPEALGSLWVAEVARAAGGGAILRDAWERAAAQGEAPTDVLARKLGENAGESGDQVLLRAAARLYAAVEPEASPSRLRLLDVQSGAIDAAAPAPFTVRHRSFLPETDETLRLAWPPDGAAGAAVVRYRDASLPPDVVFFAARDARAIPLSGVARIDWLVAGNAEGPREVVAPVYGTLSAEIPFRKLDARAESGADGARLIWTTASHEGMWGWAVFREEVRPDGRIARTGPEIVPSSESAEGSFRYQFVDSSTTPGAYYRYTVWAVTSEGVLARAFAATLRAD